MLLAATMFADTKALALQIHLDRAGYSCSTIDGIWGKKSERALQRYIEERTRDAGSLSLKDPDKALYYLDQTLTLDCDHANGLRLVADAKHILVSKAEMEGTKRMSPQIRIRFQKRWWKDVDLRTFDWNGTDGPVGKSYDVLGDGSLVMVNIPGHSEGLCALKVKNTIMDKKHLGMLGEGRIVTKDRRNKFVLLFADGGYATKSWRDMITSGFSLDKNLQRQSLQWIREQSMSPDCLESLATHDTDVTPHIIEL